VTHPLLAESIRSHRALITVIGQGYVGLPLAVEFARSGFAVTGLDTDPERVTALRLGQPHSPDVEPEDLTALLREGRYAATSDFSVLERSDVVIICVPTPLRKSKEPDISFVLAAAEEVSARFKPGQLVVLESTTYPGTTEELLLPMFQARGARAGIDLFLAFSPERIDPGNTTFRVRDIPKVVGGVTPECTRLAALLYRQIVPSVREVASPKVAELAKLYENIFRNVNIALANEFALMCRRLGVNSHDVIAAAATKPFGFMPFYPGPGVGGHCIPIDPYYFAWKVQEEEERARFIELAGQINDHMPDVVVERVGDALNERGKSVRGSRILILGVSYKRDVGDVRESPAIKVIDRLYRKGAVVEYHDPYVPTLRNGIGHLASTPLTEETIAAADCVLLLTDHRCLPLEMLVSRAQVIVDTRNALRGYRAGHIVRL
jgi:UDP-N-acetyl-D-glucosamine dehydrogenase